MRFATLCSGIGAPEVAWYQLGWEPVFSAQFDPEHDYTRKPDFPSQVLQYHYPNTPNLGDITKINGHEYNGTIDIICGGTPCQSFSIAGLRKGLQDERGNLTFEFCRLVDEIRPTWFLWENVPGVLSSSKGRDFGSILGAMDDIGYGWAYRILDAQYFGVPQQRRRVFLVGHIGGQWERAAQVLFESKSSGGDIETNGSKGANVARTVTQCAETDSGKWPVNVAPTVCQSFGRLLGLDNQHIASGAGLLVPYTRSSHGGYKQGVGTLQKNGGDVGGGSETIIVMASGQANSEILNGTIPTITKLKEKPICFLPRASVSQRFHPSQERFQTLLKTNNPAIMSNEIVRRITPFEAGRLQGFPDNYTKIFGDKTPDGPQYAAYGNSMCVPVIKWIGERIEAVHNKYKKAN